MSQTCTDVEGKASVACNVGPGQILQVHTTKDEDAKFLDQSSTSLEKLMNSVSDLDRTHSSTCRVRKISTKLEPLVGFIERYAKAVDFFVQGTDGSLLSPIALVWGMLRVVLVSASSLSRYFPKLLDMLERLRDVFSIYRRYEELFGQGRSFGAALASFYSHFLELLLKARRIFQRRGRMLLLRSLWSSFESDFQNSLDKLARLLANLEQETTLAHRKALHETLKKLEQQSQDRDASVKACESQKNRMKLMDWLSPEDSSGHLEKIAQCRTNNTGQWILQEHRFKKWESASTSSMIWVYGDPGSGKTVLATSIIQHLQSRGDLDAAVAFNFCNQADRLRQDDKAIVSSMMAQICTQSPTAPPCLEQAYQTARAYGRRQIGASDSPVTLLKTLVSGLKRLYLVVDGVDELGDGSKILTLLNNLALTTSTVHIMVLSRDLPHIRNKLTECPSIMLDALHTKEDITAFVSDAAASLPTDDAALRRAIVQLVSDKADGMFLWSKLVMDSLSQAASPRHLLSLVEEIPRSLTAVYVDFLNSLQQQDAYKQDLASKLLRWVCCSKRPLTWAEFQCAACHDEERLNDDLPVLFQPVVVQLGHPLVLYDPSKDAFRLQHLSVRDFLVNPSTRFAIPAAAGRFLVETKAAAHSLASVCLSHLLRSTGDGTPLTSYAMSFWCEHVLEAPHSDELQDRVACFLAESPRRLAWLSNKLLLDQPGFLLQNVVRLHTRLQTWLAAAEERTNPAQPSLTSDWIEDVIAILLHANLDQTSVLQENLSYFEKLMFVRDLARYLKQSNRIHTVIATLEGHLASCHGPDEDIANAWILNALGILYDQEKQTARSMSLHRRALETQTLALGPNHIQAAWTVNELGRMYRHTGDFTNAVTNHQRALAILQTSLPQDHLEVVWTENTLARAIRKQGRPGEALPLHERAHTVRSRSLGESHPHTLWVLGDMAQCYSDLGNLERAEECHRLAMKGRIEALGDEHPDTLWSINDLGVVLAERGDTAGALALQKRALEAQSRVLGTQHAHTVWTRNVLDELKARHEDPRVVHR
ncbi:hypothetical protein QQX98_008692 [Neonectria punicea]|uniref:NACHT domain-containing protein n=1 Tax=Neonectria punicea TaxID=979145 RepID=A0ABR1GUG8_9HYPO